jgi:NAD(P)-dependent dehydrogenase (short-subunit alcohol dehydrogenase family)
MRPRRPPGCPAFARFSGIRHAFGVHAKGEGVTPQQFRAIAESFTHRRKSTTLQELANVAVFAASDQASASTGTFVNLTGGIVD